MMPRVKISRLSLSAVPRNDIIAHKKFQNPHSAIQNQTIPNSKFLINRFPYHRSPMLQRLR
jgi:hypothetical protein